VQGSIAGSLAVHSYTRSRRGRCDQNVESHGAITIKKFPKLDRFGQRRARRRCAFWRSGHLPHHVVTAMRIWHAHRTFRVFAPFAVQAGKPNANYLNSELFVKAFLKPCEAVRSSIGLMMFEFSRFWPTDYEHGRDFIADLDKFLGQLPKGWPYGIEMRNRAWLRPEYFECLARHQVTHVFNSWDAMPSVGEQMALPGSRTNPDLTAARFLLKPGRKYEEAVKAFQPDDGIKEENPEARTAGRGQGSAAEAQDIRVRKQQAGGERDFDHCLHDSARVGGGQRVGSMARLSRCSGLRKSSGGATLTAKYGTCLHPAPGG